MTSDQGAHLIPYHIQSLTHSPNHESMTNFDHIIHNICNDCCPMVHQNQNHEFDHFDDTLMTLVSCTSSVPVPVWSSCGHPRHSRRLKTGRGRCRETFPASATPPPLQNYFIIIEGQLY